MTAPSFTRSLSYTRSPSVVNDRPLDIHDHDQYSDLEHMSHRCVCDRCEPRSKACLDIVYFNAIRHIYTRYGNLILLQREWKSDNVSIIISYMIFLLEKTLLSITRTFYDIHI